MTASVMPSAAKPPRARASPPAAAPSRYPNWFAAARIDITATLSSGAVSMPSALAIIDRQPFTNVISASTASVSTTVGRTAPTTTTAAPWRAVRPISSAGVARAALRRAMNVPGSIVTAVPPRASAATAGDTP